MLLLACGFIAAKTFGPPDLAQRLVESWRPDQSATLGEFQPAPLDQHQTAFLPPLEMNSPPAGFPAPAQLADRAAPPSAAGPWAASGTASPTLPAASWNVPADPWPNAAEPALLTSSYELELAPLRPVPTTPAGAPAAAERGYDSGFGTPQPTNDQPMNDWRRPAAAPSGWAPAPAAAALPAREASFGGAPPAAGGGEQPAPPAYVAAYPEPASTPGWTDWRSEPAAELTPLQPLPAQAGEGPDGRTHIVADGDSLTRLAERYLGDAARSTEIYEKNRDLLTHPELLPLGVELRMP